MRAAWAMMLLLASCGSSKDDAAPADGAVADSVGADVIASDGGVDAPSEGAADVAPDTSVGGLTFKLCPAGYTGACAIADVPLDHDAPDGKTIKLLINRMATSPKATRQLWVLQGGPGGSVSDLDQIALSLGRALPDFDIYGLEHRGVGTSTALTCKGDVPDLDKAAADTVFSACAEDLTAKWGVDGLHQFSTTQAAKDLGWAIDKVRKPGDKVFVYGVSYGTYWATRYLQVRGDQPDGVIFDSLVAPGVQFFSQFDLQFDAVAKKIAESCKTDAVCKAHLGDDPWARVQELTTKIKTGTCPAAGDGRLIMNSLATMMQLNGLNTFAFAALYRYGRCSKTDGEALTKMSSLYGHEQVGPKFSHPLYFNVALSELWETPAPSEAALKALTDAAAIPAYVWELAALQAIWPKYPHDAYFGAYPVTTKPILVLAGTLDAQTPIELARDAKTHYTAPGQFFVEVPNASHGVIIQSTTTVSGAPPCGQDIVVSFLESAGAKADTTCVADVAPPAFTFDPAFVKYVFAQPDAWDDTSPFTRPPSASPRWSPERLESSMKNVWRIR